MHTHISKITTTKISVTDPIYAADFSNDQILVGASHNVFVGRVLEQEGTKERGIGPETQFKVSIIQNIKGDLSGEIVVDQQGGYKDGVLYAVGDKDDVLKAQKEGSYLLQPGSTYVFATRYNEKENWYTLNSYPTALKLISSTIADSRQLESLAVNDSRVKELQEAYTKEILLDADVKSNKALNSYASTQEKETPSEKPIDTPFPGSDKPSSTEESISNGSSTTPQSTNESDQSLESTPLPDTNDSSPTDQ